jgi:DNA-binding XRE family transcriptional regulator
MRLRSRLALVSLIDAVGMSEREVARRALLSHATVNHLVTGRRATCSLATAVAIENVLSARLGAIFVPESGAERAAMELLSTEQNGRSR